MLQDLIQNVDPDRDCQLCPRLVEFRHQQRSSKPDDWFNSPVPTFKAANNVQLLIVGLAPGLKGANRTGRVFTGDFAGEFLYRTLLNFRFSVGEFAAHANDGLELIDCAITNAVRCVPPKNKPVGAEVNNCRIFLKNTIEHFSQLNVILALGRIAHDSILRALKLKVSAFPFKHASQYQISDKLALFDSYHCSRYNTNTGVLTEKMFYDVFANIRRFIEINEKTSNY